MRIQAVVFQQIGQQLHHVSGRVYHGVQVFFQLLFGALVRGVLKQVQVPYDGAQGSFDVVRYGKQQFFPAFHQFLGTAAGHFQIPPVFPAFIQVSKNKQGGEQNDQQSGYAQYGQ